MLVVRDAEPVEAAALAGIYQTAEGQVRSALGGGEVEELPALVGWIEDRLAARGRSPIDRCLVAELDGRPVGYTELAAPDELQAIYVVPAQWGTGIATALHARAIDHLRACGVAVARLSVFAGNARARRFYERAGWRFAGEERTLAFGTAELVLVRYRLRL